MPEMNIRHAASEDLHRIVEIYNHYVEQTPITFDLELHTFESRRAWFDTFALTGRHQLLVGTLDDHVIGYANTMQLRYKRAYDTSVETSVYLDPDQTGHGFGGQLYEALFETISGEDIHCAFAGITLPNDASIRLHTRFGFESAGVWPQVGRKFDRYWDVQWMVKTIGAALE